MIERYNAELKIMESTTNTAGELVPTKHKTTITVMASANGNSNLAVLQEIKTLIDSQIEKLLK